MAHTYNRDACGSSHLLSVEFLKEVHLKDCNCAFNVKANTTSDDAVLAIMSVMMVKLWLQRVNWGPRLRSCQLHYLRCKAVVISLNSHAIMSFSSNNSSLCFPPNWLSLHPSLSHLLPHWSTCSCSLLLYISPIISPSLSFFFPSLMTFFSSLYFPSITNEAGASIYSVSPEAVKEMPDMDPNHRSAGMLG